MLRANRLWIAAIATSKMCSTVWKHARPPVQKEAITSDDIKTMVATLPFDLRRLGDPAILFIGYAGGRLHSEIVCLDFQKEDNTDSGGWVKVMKASAPIRASDKTS